MVRHRTDEPSPPGGEADPQLAAYRSAALNALPGRIAVLDRHGIVVACNQAWGVDAVAPGALPEPHVGEDYPSACGAALSQGDPGRPLLVDQIKAVLQGGPPFESVYPNHTAERARWVRLSASPLDAALGGAVIMYVDVSAQIQSEVRLHRLANYDELTGLLRRRRFMERLEEAFRSARRYGHPLSAAIVDVDDFKSVNDAYGHAVGDQCLSVFAAVLSGAVRATDFVGRYGGDEFVLCFPHTRAADAAAGVDRIRAQLPARLAEAGLPRISGTFGVVELRPEHQDPAALMNAADAALYRGKSRGRDRTEVEATAHVPYGA